MKITIVAGARPNFMKVAPIIKAINRKKSSGSKIDYRLVHTGQHYSNSMSCIFFEQLGIPKPDENLGCGCGTHAEQTGAIMKAFEKELLANPVDVVLVVGDVTSTMACALVAKKLNTQVVHVEGGIRSWDLSMPEEINRLVTDSITDHFFTTSEIANENLRNSGVESERIHFVGNTMIDTLLENKCRFKNPYPRFFDTILETGKYYVLTMHRPANVDEEQHLKRLLKGTMDACGNYPMVFPVHPRTAQVIKKLGIAFDNLVLTEPLPYLEFNFLVQNALAVITDSGGITEEASIMNIPCLTLRNNTERPETIELGTNELVGTDPTKLKPWFDKLINGEWKQAQTIPLWDGKASERIVKALLEIFS